MYPQVKFRIDKDLDKWKMNEFLHQIKSGDYFKKGIYDMHPDLEKTEDIDGYIDCVYKDNIDEFTKKQKQITKHWSKFNEPFVEFNNKIYKEILWPKGEYVGYLSISQPYPRFLNTATFQVDAFHIKKSVVITAHEMGHFIFFEYVRNRYTPKIKKLDEGKLNRALYNKLKIPLWELSEVHVVMLMQTPEFQNIIINQSRPYPNHEEYYNDCKKYWKKANGDMDKFFDMLEK